MKLIGVYLLSLAATVPVTIFLCRFWLWLKKRPSYGTVIAAPCIMVFALLVLDSGGGCFTPSYWSLTIAHKDPEWPFSMLRLLGFNAVISALPALAVVAYFQSRNKRSETELA
jgi:hypothetical protein